MVFHVVVQQQMSKRTDILEHWGEMVVCNGNFEKSDIKKATNLLWKKMKNTDKKENQEKKNFFTIVQ